jgi:hypothetical protein
MKNSTRLFYFGGAFLLLILLTLPLMSHAQEAVQSSGGLFSKVGDWLKTGFLTAIISFAGGILAQKGWTARIKAIAHKGAIVLKGFGHILTDGGNILETIDNSIHDDDSIDAKGILDAIGQSKNVIVETKDAVISITKKV